jgi:hypothetical protein
MSRKPAPAPERLSPQAYADRRKVSRQAVMKAIETGRLEKAAKRNDRGHWRIDPELADSEWESWTDPAQKREGKAGGRPPGVATTGELFPGAARQAQEQRLTMAAASARRSQADA